jgi:hypothetical protein
LSSGKPQIYGFVMYSDNQGATWTLGEELGTTAGTGPQGGQALVWDECALTELKNGSILFSSRIDDPENSRHHPDTNLTRVHTSRGFARSDGEQC